MDKPDYSCADAERDMDYFFQNISSPSPKIEIAALVALNNAFAHMTEGTTLERSHIDCPACWERYKKLKSKSEHKGI